jgi:hypothetical protein
MINIFLPPVGDQAVIVGHMLGGAAVILYSCIGAEAAQLDDLNALMEWP